MPITELFSGVRNITASEVSLSANNTGGPTAQTTTGIFQTFIDVSGMIAGDALQIRVYEKCRAGDVQQIVHDNILVDTQQEPLWVSPALTLMKGWDITANSINGTTIKTLWSIRQVS